jgi:hypothetical protein
VPRHRHQPNASDQPTPTTTTTTTNPTRPDPTETKPIPGRSLSTFQGCKAQSFVSPAAVVALALLLMLQDYAMFSRFEFVRDKADTVATLAAGLRWANGYTDWFVPCGASCDEASYAADATATTTTTTTNVVWTVDPATGAVRGRMLQGGGGASTTTSTVTSSLLAAAVTTQQQQQESATTTTINTSASASSTGVPLVCFGEGDFAGANSAAVLASVATEVFNMSVLVGGLLAVIALMVLAAFTVGQCVVSSLLKVGWSVRSRARLCVRVRACACVRSGCVCALRALCVRA